MITCKQVTQLKRWRIVLVLALVIITLGNGRLLASMRDLSKSHIKSLQDMNTAYQNLLGAYDEQKENCDYYLEQLQKQQLEK